MAEVTSLTPEEAFERLKEIMVREFDLKDGEILLSSGFEELQLDSIDAVDLAIWLEQEIEYQFDNDDLSELRTMQDVVDLICSKPRRMKG